jgi:hypothetical protein
MYLDITYKYSPEVYEHEQPEIQHSMDRKQENEEVVWHRLEVSVHWMECMRCKRRWDYKFLRQLRDSRQYEKGILIHL